MPDDPNPGQEPNDPPAQDADDQNEQPEQASDETFDKDRALSTIRKLREGERAAKAQAKELEALKAKLAEHESAQLTEKEKAEQRAANAEAKAQAAEAKAKAIALRASVERHAHKLNLVDSDAAYRLLDLSGIEYEDDEPQGIEALLKALVKDRPWLGAPEPKTGVPATPSAANGKQLSQAEDAANRQAFSRQVQRMFR